MSNAHGRIREWIKWNAHNGDSVTWFSHDVLRLRGNITVWDLENLAMDIHNDYQSKIEALEKDPKWEMEMKIDILERRLKKAEEALAKERSDRQRERNGGQ